MANKFEIATIFKAVDKMTAPISRMQSKLATFTRSAQTGFRGVTKAVGSFTSAIGVASVLSLAALTSGMTQATTAGIDFEQTMVGAAARFSGGITKGSAEFDKLQAAAMQAGATTEFTAQAAAEALSNMAMAGMDANTAIASLPGVIDMATAAQVDLAAATSMANDTLGAFNLNGGTAEQTAKNLARVSNVMAKGSNMANLSMEEMFEAMKKGGPVATMAGQSLETVAAMLGMMANAGIKGELAGTAVANALLNIANPKGDAVKVIKRLGISMYTSAGKMKQMPDLLDEIAKKTAKLTDVQKQRVVEAIYGREGLAGNIAVLTSGGDQLRKMTKELVDADNYSKNLADTLRNTTRGSLNSLNSAIESVSIKLFSMTGGPIKEVIDRTTDWVRANGDVVASGIGEWVLKLADNIDTLVVAAKGVGIFVGSVWALNAALTVANALAAVNPFVLMAMAIAAAAVAIYTHWDPISEYFSELWANTTAGFSNMWDGIKSLGADAMAWLGREWDGFINRWINRINSVTGMFGFDPIAMRGPVAQERPTGLVNGDVPAFEMVTPQQRTAQSLSETRTTNTTEVVIRDETTHSTVTQTGGKTPGLKLQSTGGF